MSGNVLAVARLKPQAAQMLHAMQARGSLSVREAAEMGCWRLAARVKEIREAFGESAVVTDTEEHNGGHHARYRWVGDACHQAELDLS